MKFQFLGLALSLVFSVAANAEGVMYRYSSNDAYQEAAISRVEVQSYVGFKVLSIYVDTKKGEEEKSCTQIHVPTMGWAAKTFPRAEDFADALRSNKYFGKIMITEYSWPTLTIDWAHGRANGTYALKGTCALGYLVEATSGTEVQYRFSKQEPFQAARVHAMEVESVGPMTVMHTFVKLQNGTVTKSCATQTGFDDWMAKSFEDPMGMADMLATNGIGGKLVVTQYSHGQYSVSDIHPAVNGTYGAGTCIQHYEAAAAK